MFRRFKLKDREVLLNLEMISEVTPRADGDCDVTILGEPVVYHVDASFEDVAKELEKWRGPYERALELLSIRLGQLHELFRQRMH